MSAYLCNAEPEQKGVDPDNMPLFDLNIYQINVLKERILILLNNFFLHVMSNNWDVSLLFEKNIKKNLTTHEIHGRFYKLKSNKIKSFERRKIP